MTTSTDDGQLCGITRDYRGTEYPPCTRPAGHVEAYCHTADGTHFLAHPDEPAAGTDVAALLADNQHLRQQLARAEAPIEHVRRLCADPVHRFTIARADVLAALDSVEPAEETHVVADSSDDPEHTDDCPGCETAASDTLPAWLAQRFDPRGPGWDDLTDDDRAYWEHQARAVRRAVARGGFKDAAARPAATTQDSQP